jgi:Glycosyltransferase family 10 (fucosyltransferase) C-term
MKIVKLTTPWKLPYVEQSPNGAGVWGDYKFEINNDCDEADYWVVWGWEPKPSKKVRVPKNHVVYLTDEAHAWRYYHAGYLAQFERVVTPRKDLEGGNIVPFQEMAPWYLPMDWDAMEKMPPPDKLADTLSVISSNLTHLPGHLQRFAFVNQCMGHFKGRLHAYGRGIRPVEDKREAFFPYPYTMALENSAIDDYFTEKIREVFLSYSYPFYWGCPNLETYFDKDSFSFIDIYDLKASLEIIEEAIAKDYRNQRLDLLVAQRNKVLYTYHLFPALCRMLNTLPEAGPVKKVHITPEDQLWKQDKSLVLKALHKLRTALS